jgi:transcription antitermination factor NusG
MNDQSQKVMVNVSMFGRATDVELDFVQVKKVEVAPVEEV